MNPIPPDIDSLMWLVAESGDDKAITDFEGRYPHLKTELGKRLALVAGLKQARPSVPVVKPAVPAFKPLDTVRPRGVNTPKIVAGGAALVLVALTSFWLTNDILSAAAPHDPPGKSHVSHEPSFEGTPDIQLRIPPRGGRAPAADPSAGLPPDGTPPAPPAKAGPETPAYRKPIVMHIDRAPLQTILRAVGMQGQLTVEFAPGMDDPEIKVDYDGQTAIEILQDLGTRFGFTAFDEGGGHVLVVPAVDHNTGQGGFSKEPDQAVQPSG